MKKYMYSRHYNTWNSDVFIDIFFGGEKIIYAQEIFRDAKGIVVHTYDYVADRKTGELVGYMSYDEEEKKYCVEIYSEYDLYEIRNCPENGEELKIRKKINMKYPPSNWEKSLVSAAENVLQHPERLDEIQVRIEERKKNRIIELWEYIFL